MRPATNALGQYYAVRVIDDTEIVVTFTPHTFQISITNHPDQSYEKFKSIIIESLKQAIDNF